MFSRYSNIVVIFSLSLSLSPHLIITTQHKAGIADRTSPLPAICVSPIPTESAQSVPSNLTASLHHSLTFSSVAELSSNTTTATASSSDPIITGAAGTGTGNNNNNNGAGAGDLASATSSVFPHMADIDTTAPAASATATATPGNNPLPAVSETSPKECKQAAGSFKSVSFSATNQTLQSDNTIRNSSTRMEIQAKAAPAAALPNISTNAGDFVSQRLSGSGAGGSSSSSSGGGLTIGTGGGGGDMEVVEQYDAAARSINAVPTTGAYLCLVSVDSIGLMNSALVLK